MSKIDEDEDGLKQFFSNVASRYNINYDERDWKKMEKMLDDEEARMAATRAARWRLSAAIGVSLLIVLTTFYFFIYPAPRLTSSSPQAADEKNSALHTSRDSISARSTTSLVTPTPGNQKAKDGLLVDGSKTTIPVTPSKKSIDLGNKKEVPVISILKNSNANAQEKEVLPTVGAIRSKNENLKKKDTPLQSLKNEKENEAPYTIQNNESQQGKRAGVYPLAEKKIGESVEKKSTELESSQLVPSGTQQDSNKKENTAAYTGLQNRNGLTKPGDTSIEDSNIDSRTNKSNALTSQGTSAKVDSTYLEETANAIENNKKAVVSYTKAEQENSKALVTVNRTDKTRHEAIVPPTNTVATLTATTTEKNSVGDTVLLSKKLKPVIVNDSIKAVPPVAEDKLPSKEDTTLTVSKEDSTRAYSRWSITLAVAPDFTSSKIFNQALTGGAFGLTFQYSLSKRFSLQTGALLAIKKYWNAGSEYSSIKGYWKARTNGIVPERINGKCTVLEIPLSVRYTVFMNTKNIIQASVGASSYIMFHEIYSYNFEYPNPTAAQSWESSKTLYYMASIGSLSLAYERLIHPKLALGIEPYAKIPFTKLGWPNLPLYTMGAYITLRYKIFKKAKKG